MNKFVRSSLLSVIALTAACVGAGAQTQARMNQDACRAYQEADAEMNKVYQQVLNEYKSETAFIQKFKAAQRAWIAFRNAHVESLYPKPNKLAEYGSVYPTCRCGAMSEITTARTELLKRWIKGGEEGDTCSGSVKIKN